MSFLEQTTDDVVTVAEAIAFIDAFEAKSDNDHLSPSIDSLLTPLSNDNSSSSSEVGNKQKTMLKGKPKRKTKANPPGYTTEVQRRKRAELQNLRTEAQELEERLNLLRTLKPSSQTQHADEEALAFRWKELVEIERTRRQHSEETNRRLRAALSHYLGVNKNLRRILQKNTPLKGLDLVFGDEPTPNLSFAAFENSKAITGHLENLLTTLYLETGSHFDSWGSSAISFSMQMKFEKKRGRVAEMKATTPVACTIEEAAELMWLEQSGHRPDPLKWTRRVDAWEKAKFPGKELGVDSTNPVLREEGNRYPTTAEVRGAQPHRLGQD